jgi:DMSO/TMAO reductase YedYZ molybdopterin-dependent catalytic subunit
MRTRRINASVDRRDFLRCAAAAALPFFWTGGAALFAADDAHSAKLIPRETNPNNLEFPFATLDKPITSNELFYIRNHFAQLHVEKADWRLKVIGAVERPLELTYEQLLDLPSVTKTVTLECAGNGRAFLTPKAKGVQWELGAVSTAEWTGVPLSKVLEKAGLRAEAMEVVLEGPDKGEPKNDAKPAGAIPFARSLPLAKAQSAEVLLAYKMNGAVLPEAHGFPLRAIVGGWYGMASVKWLSRIIVADRPFDGFFQGIDYAYWERRYGLPTLKPITEMDVKASIAQPEAGATVPANATVRVHGAAWAGESEPAKVEVSTDSGGTWAEAKLLGEGAPMAWRLWEFNWKTPADGKRVLMARATDKRGRVQPMERDADRRNYRISHVLPTEVVVKPLRQ